MPSEFSKGEQEVLYRVMRERRDMRHFIPNSSIDVEVLQRILNAAHTAPSVGLMQPWRFIQIKNTRLREAVVALVDAERKITAELLAERESEFLKLKVEGIRECAALIAVVQAPDDGTIFGRRTLPEEMALCSTACAIQNMWLASRVENLGLGWVSFFDPQALSELLACPDGAKPVALLCIGPVKQFYSKPLLEQTGWRKSKPLEDVLFENTWPESGE
ncbi:Cobalamin biosynthesis protein BluB @ 5,6-dimethylbenzimidazole synthase, flavin destructase family [hydrothermal vent metagenome]|uniref:Cobalamin biosynthesis protein BluB @ 5,6-dimethylbenzimidazole synthase, flavin destructase family n=1 Tax=hydrothermal vent metagenome TaxID=652676 RepID=A0A3B0ZY42_9ZZZZ